ncbi:hypothetical protein LOK49_Contig389G00001 [Camellia lanceoleosa]|nr:hypothetical protein LOK49_Contig389G00001 [Camellia lanceoleosa]
MKRLEDLGALSFILDLRDNLGGLVQVGIEIAKLFLNQGETVLVNKNTASASEIVSASMTDEVFVNQLWKDLFAKPHEWWDIRLKKGNSTAAAFENKDNGQLLWINESTPEWIQKKLECLTFDPKIAPKAIKVGPCKKSKNWKDHRKNKLNNLLKPKHPDFKHKDSGVPLWLNTAPKWVLSGLDGLEFDVPLLNVKQAKGSKGWYSHGHFLFVD